MRRADLRPRRPPAGLRAGAWAIWAVATAAGIGALTHWTMARSPIPQGAPMRAILEVPDMAVEVALPSEAPIARILAEDGARVRRGQTLAMLDLDAIARVRAATARRRMAAALRLLCLADIAHRRGVTMQVQVDPGPAPIDRSDANIVAAACRQEEANRFSAPDRLDDELDILARRSRLMDRRIEAMRATLPRIDGMPGTERRQARLVAFLDRLLEANELELEAHRKRARRDALNTQARTRLAEDMARARDELAKIDARLDHLASLADDPRLLSPAEGYLHVEGAAPNPMRLLVDRRGMHPERIELVAAGPRAPWLAVGAPVAFQAQGPNGAREQLFVARLAEERRSPTGNPNVTRFVLDDVRWLKRPPAEVGEQVLMGRMVTNGPSLATRVVEELFGLATARGRGSEDLRTAAISLALSDQATTPDANAPALAPGSWENPGPARIDPAIAAPGSQLGTPPTSEEEAARMRNALRSILDLAATDPAAQPHAPEAARGPAPVPRIPADPARRDAADDAGTSTAPEPGQDPDRGGLAP